MSVFNSIKLTPSENDSSTINTLTNLPSILSGSLNKSLALLTEILEERLFKTTKP